jgi:hypothetical protein
MVAHRSFHVRALSGGALLAALLLVSCSTQESAVPVTTPSADGGAAVPTASAATSTLERQAARFAPTEIRADLSKFSSADKQVLGKLIEASKIVDALFLRQVWAGNESMLLDLVCVSQPPCPCRSSTSA